ncbi:MAG: bifunctional folylpolyglutamate synthase/dihydrofolate synthase [Gaiellaceae bacterium]
MSAGPHTRWIESLSPWPEQFGLDRMEELLLVLGEPQAAYEAIHVVGTNGKSTTTRATAALLRRAGLRTGAYTSPHVRGWSERIQVDGRDADFEYAIGRVREAAERTRATQFEALTAAALAAFADAGVDVAVVEAGLGGRLDATNVLGARVVVLTNVSLEHTDVLGDTREAIACEKLAVVGPNTTVVLGEAEWEAAARAAGSATVVVAAAEGAGLGPSLALARAAAAAFLGRGNGHEEDRWTPGNDEIALAGRYELRSDGPVRELWDGAHNPAGAAHLARSLAGADAVLVVSLVADKDVDGVLRELAGLGSRLVATTSSSPRALGADELAAGARAYFDHVETVADPHAAAARARALASPYGTVLVTGSLYLLADLHSVP